ncbi:hypothetical protein E1301_Tti014041 [Triplophysa tibetana]|uniref:HAT C-terminal dimerisation domain-containing protein n=1 Tax=Triplophysa tibetana TaxID=1572043 RepID=A0A5A9NB76_9TELE|nr:hypothetical protein E1301_Tti014041 [Triplophysa tibetana]
MAGLQIHQRLKCKDAPDPDLIVVRELVNPGKFDDMRQAFPEEAFQSVLKSYGHHFDSGRLRSELQVLYSDQDLQSNRGKLCDYLVFLKDMELDSAMPQLYKLFSLVATIGATSAGVERSFSCLKRLKSYTRNTMGQGRLSSLALLAIERTLVKSLEKTPSWAAQMTFNGAVESQTPGMPICSPWSCCIWEAIWHCLPSSAETATVVLQLAD